MEWEEEPSGIFPSLKWLDYSDGKKGLTVIHRGIPENEVRDGDVYLTVLRSVSMLSSDGISGPAIPVPDARELNKRYEFRYSVYPHEGDWREASSYKHAIEFNTDLDTLQLPKGMKLSLNRSFLKIYPENVVLSALKRAEDGDGVILRFYETKGEETDAEYISFPCFPIRRGNKNAHNLCFRFKRSNRVRFEYSRDYGGFAASAGGNSTILGLSFH